MCLALCKHYAVLITLAPEFNFKLFVDTSHNINFSVTLSIFGFLYFYINFWIVSLCLWYWNIDWNSFESIDSFR